MTRVALFISLVSVLAGCSADPCLTRLDPWPDPSGTRLNLAQCWEKKDLTRFYTTSLGTQLVRYDLVMPLNMAVPDPSDPKKLTIKDEPFFTKSHIEDRWRFLALETSDWDEQSNVNKADIESGWPVGFVVDERTFGKPEWQGKWIGPTCAACHTGQVEYQGKKLRVAGGPSMADISLFLSDLKNSLEAVHADGLKGGDAFKRYVERYAKRFGPEDSAKLLGQLKATIDERAGWHQRNDFSASYGYARLDAFGVIYNEVIQMTGKVGFARPDAPVSYPFLWHFSSHNQTQWNGSGPAMPMVVNVAGSLGIFAKYDPDAGWFEDPSTARLSVLGKLQDLIDELRSPPWPEDILGKHDAGKVARGKSLFESKCRVCHAQQPRNRALKRVNVTMVSAKEIQTDGKMAENANRRLLADPDGENRKRVAAAMAGATFDIIFSSSHPGAGFVFLGEALSAAFLPKRDLIPGGPAEAYKARPLEGIWATAPYLHNGSVPSLYELLLPRSKRTPQFCVGSREFDPKHVGFVMLSEVECRAKNLYWLDTAREGDHNSGHEGPSVGVETDEEAWALVEYLKTL